MKFWNLIPDAETPSDGVLDIEGPIAEEDWFEDATTPKAFKKTLAGLKNVTVHINSPGGDVLAGADIYSALREHSLNGKGRVKVIITALAASAASVVAMAGDEILISPVAYMMIHNPWSMAVGDAREMRKTAKTLDEITEGLITAYQQRTGKSRDQMKRMLENETWMSAQTCVDEGFADGIYGGEIRAAACAGAGMLTRATPESVRELCARWEKARGAKAAEEEPEDPEKPEAPEEPNEAEAEKAKRSEKRRAKTDPEEAPGADPAEEDPEDPDEDPEEDPEDRAADADGEDPDEDDGEDPEKPEEEPDNADGDEEDPDGDDGEDPEEPEDADGDEEDPDGEDPEDPEDPEEEPEDRAAETAKRAEIARRAAILAGLEWQQ